jgi:hypothetical protein
MPLDEALYNAARRARDRLEEAQIEAERARSEYHEAIWRLHSIGGSLREIAEVMQISHQRVHQIIDGAACSFCDARRADVTKLIAGPGVFICERCLTLALRVIASERDASDDRTIIQMAAAGPSVKCSFCRKKAKRVGLMAERGETRICGRCLSLCTEIVASS